VAHQGNFIAYYRVSTAKQGHSGLGLDAQRIAVLDYLNGGHWQLVGSFTEVESGKRSDRPQLAAAMAMCRLKGATLVIAKLDRLTRNVAFLANLMETDVPFVACDNPHATRFTLHILSAVAEHERAMISQRTKAALQAAKARGTQLGGYRGTQAPDGRLGGAAVAATADAYAARLRPTLTELQAAGLSLHGMASELTARGIVTPRGGAWTATAVRRALARTEG
jgi:DNA invertase Pin-like site-specific DNA recombinase